MAKATVGSEECYFDGYLLQNLARMKEILDDDFDCVIAVDGGEGSGKSTLAMQVGKYLDNSLVLDRVVFTAEDFMKAVHVAEKKQCVIYDEAYTGFSSHDTMGKVNKVL